MPLQPLSRAAAQGIRFPNARIRPARMPLRDGSAPPPRSAANDNSDPGPEPPVMTWWKAAPVLAITIIFDCIRLFFEFFWITGPALVGTVAGALVAEYLGEFIGWLTTAFVGVGAGLALGAAFAAVGVVFAMAIGFMGWLALTFLLLVTNTRIFKADRSALITLCAGLGIAELPFIGGLPSLTGAAARLYRTQIKKERADHAAWQEKHDRMLEEERAMIAAYVARRRTALAMRPAQDEEEIPYGERAAA